MPGDIHLPVRSVSLVDPAPLYEAVKQTDRGLAKALDGGDPIPGSHFIDMELFENSRLLKPSLWWAKSAAPPKKRRRTLKLMSEACCGLSQVLYLRAAYGACWGDYRRR